MTFRINSLINLLILSAGIGVGISYSDFYLFHFMFVTVFFGFFYLALKNSTIRLINLPTKTHYIFYFLIFIYFISILWSINIALSLKYLVYVILGSCLSLAMVFSLTSLDKYQESLYKIKYLIYILIIISLLEIFTGFRWPTSPISEFAPLLKKDSAFFLNYMPTGFFGNPNNLAITLNMTLPFFLLQRNITYKIIVPLLILVIIWYTNSRGCLAAYLLTLILYVFLVDIKKTILGFFILLWVVLIILLYEPFLNLIINFLDPFKQYLTFEGLNNSNSDGKRLNYILKGWESIQNNFFLGIGGYGSFVILNGASMHNIWVEMIVDIGVIGFSIFIFWYMIIIIKIYMIAIFSADKDMRYYSQSIFISISVFLFSSISASSVIYHLPTWILFGFAVSIINIDKSSKSK